MSPVVFFEEPDDKQRFDAVQEGQPPRENCHLENGFEGTNGEYPAPGARLFIQQYMVTSTKCEQSRQQYFRQWRIDR